MDLLLFLVIFTDYTGGMNHYYAPPFQGGNIFGSLFPSIMESWPKSKIDGGPFGHAKLYKRIEQNSGGFPGKSWGPNRWFSMAILPRTCPDHSGLGIIADGSCLAFCLVLNFSTIFEPRSGVLFGWIFYSRFVIPSA